MCCLLLLFFSHQKFTKMLSTCACFYTHTHTNTHAYCSKKSELRPRARSETSGFRASFWRVLVVFAPKTSLKMSILHSIHACIHTCTHTCIHTYIYRLYIIYTFTPFPRSPLYNVYIHTLCIYIYIYIYMYGLLFDLFRLICLCLKQNYVNVNVNTVLDLL